MASRALPRLLTPLRLSHLSAPSLFPASSSSRPSSLRIFSSTPLTLQQSQSLPPLPSPPVDYHSLFYDSSDPFRPKGTGFDVDARDLRARFLRKQMAVHPDAWSGKGEKEHQLALAHSSLLNKAYSTLLDPLSRAVYLLERQGLTIDEAEGIDDPELLMEVLEVREQLEEAGSAEEAASVREGNQENVKAALADLSSAFSAGDYDAAKAAAIKLRYFTKIDEAAREWAPGKRVELKH